MATEKRFEVVNLLHTIQVGGEFYAEESEELTEAINDPANREDLNKHIGADAIVVEEVEVEVEDPWDDVPHSHILREHYDSVDAVLDADDTDLMDKKGLAEGRVSQIREQIGYGDGEAHPDVTERLQANDQDEG